MGFALFSVSSGIVTLNSVNRLIFVTVKCYVFFAVRTVSQILFRGASALGSSGRLFFCYAFIFILCMDVNSFIFVL
jgi:hypothetical protein